MPNLTWIFVILIPVCILWNLWFFGRAYVRRMRNHPFPERKQCGFVFQEKRASGNSDTDFKSRYGGASNCITVTVTHDELLLWTPDVMAAISERVDLECRVALADIESVTPKHKRVVEVRHRLEDGSLRTLTLQLKGVDRFVKALGHEV